MTVYLRGSSYHLRKRVPLRFRRVEEREIIAISLHTDSPSEARRKGEEVWSHLIQGWEAALRGDATSARLRYDSAKEIADRRGFTYLPAPSVAELPLGEILRRVDGITTRRDRAPDQRTGDALLGGVEDPGMTVSEALEEFWKISIDQVRGKTPDQVRRWENPKRKAIANFIKVVSDKRLDQITREDASKFRDWWNAKIDKEGLSSNSAIKDFTHVAHTLRTVAEAKGIKADLPLGKLKIKATPKAERLPFSDKHIKDVLLKAGALDGMNEEARTIFLMMVNTGCRPSELAGLMKRHIHADAEVPYIEIKPDGRELKNATSARKVPLVGASLDAAKAWQQLAPKGEMAFPRYFGKDGGSVTINKFLRENKLLQTDRHTLYGLRHAFEDRCLRAGIDERIRRDLMGHALDRQRYGEGGGLAHVHALLQGIAL
jgi:integrase